MESDPALDALKSEWERVQDGATGLAYGEALEELGRIDVAASVYRQVGDLGFTWGYFELAWLENERGSEELAESLMAQTLALFGDDPEGDLAAGVLGMWRWDRWNRTDAEALLRRGQDQSNDARADLGQLLRATGRAPEAEAVLRVGVSRGEVSSFIVLGNLLGDDDRLDEAEEMYRRGFELGDSFSAFNLARLLERQDRDEEAAEWMWLAAKGGDEAAIRDLAESEIDHD